MNRRGFLRSLGLGAAAVYLRLAPEKLSAVPVGYFPASAFMASGIVEVPYMPLYFARSVLLADLKPRSFSGISLL